MARARNTNPRDDDGAEEPCDLAAAPCGKARDDADQASRAKSRFLAAISHELRTPLNGILGCAELLRMEGGLDERQAARVEAMLGAGRHLLDLIRSVLELSEIEIGRGESRKAPAVLRSIAEGCLDLVRPKADDKGLALGLFIEPGLPSQIVSDPTRLRQVLVNLLANAVKFTARGGVDLRILKSCCGAKLRFEVADTGPGIPASEVGRLFKEFERLEIDASNKVEGAGLGLALAAGIASLICTDLGYEDKPGGGSVFWLEVLIDPVPSDQLAPSAARGLDRNAAPGFRALRVLVVDDVAMNRDIASAFLQAAGHSVQCAESGAAALEAVTSAHFDVVLMDVRMPDMGGLEATRHIRALDGARGKVAVVALTAQAFTEQVRECLEAGMDTHLSKPFSKEALIAIVASAFEAARARVRACSPVPGSELSVVNPTNFAVTASCLSADAVAAHLRTIAGLCETLLRDLDSQDATGCFAANQADAAHTLAGSAGLFGFERLSKMGREFERAVQSAAPGVRDLADGLRAAIAATIQEIEANRLHAVES